MTMPHMASRSLPRATAARRSALLVLAGLVLLQAAVIGLVVAAESQAPHGVRLGVVAPRLVAQALVTRPLAPRSGALPDGTVDATVVLSATEARDAVASSDLDAAVVVDLTADTDRLLVSAIADPDLVGAAQVVVDATSSSYGRAVRLEEVDPPRNAGTSRVVPFALVLVWLVVGVALAAALTLARGPVAATWTDGARRVGALGLAGAVLGLAVGLGASVLASGAVLSLWVCGTLTTWAAAWATLALERLVGLLGIGVAVTLLLGLATPLVTAADPRNLVAPWSTVATFTPHHAALDWAQRAVFAGTAPSPADVALLGAWCLIALLVLVVARRADPATR